MLTVFAWLEVLYVALTVCVVTASGVGSHVLAILMELDGYLGLALLAVIFVPGLPCMGAYLMDPVCRVYVTVALTATAPPAAAPSAPAAL